jgi:hypothetical protein
VNTSDFRKLETEIRKLRESVDALRAQLTPAPKRPKDIPAPSVAPLEQPSAPPAPPPLPKDTTPRR